MKTQIPTRCVRHGKVAFFALLVSLLGPSASRADVFLDLSSVTPGGPGTGAFSGTLGGISVTGLIPLGPAASLSFNAVGAGINNSTIAGTSPQFSYATVFSPTAATTDRIGFDVSVAVTNSISISFGSPVTNPVFHIANFDIAQWSFAGNGASGMTLLNGNGSGGDGLDPTFGGGFFFVQDLNPATSNATAPTSTPPTSGSRSAYGSVQLNGTFSTINIGAGLNGPPPDVGGGSFTISIVPEPSSLMLLGLGALGAARFVRRRGR